MNLKWLFLIFIYKSYVESTEKLSKTQEDDLFEVYLEMFNISFDSHHRQIFSYSLSDDSLTSKKNAKKYFLQTFYSIEKHNRRFQNGKETFRQAIHQFAHFSRKEFLKYRTGLAKPSNVFNSLSNNNATITNMSKSMRLTYPEYFNWVDRALAAVEGQMGLQGNNAKLSEQEVIDCATHEIEFERIFLGCKGGDDTAVYNFAKMHKGVTSEYAYPYQMRVNRCNTNRSKVHGSTVRSYVKLPVNEEYIKEVLFLHGPLYASFHASDAFTAYSNGIFTDPNGDCYGEKSNHAALLVGWGSEHGLDYWILKNSYDTWWGEGGYFRIARGYNLCNIASDVSYPIIN
ncbi:hypothetical protein ACKWTF_007645 [Chironomus riparius]